METNNSISPDRFRKQIKAMRKAERRAMRAGTFNLEEANAQLKARVAEALHSLNYTSAQEKEEKEGDADSDKSSSSDHSRLPAKVPKPLDPKDASHETDRNCSNDSQIPMPDINVPVSDNIINNDSIPITVDSLVQEGPPPPPVVAGPEDDGFTVVRRKKAARSSASGGSTIKPRVHPAERRERGNKRPPPPSPRSNADHCHLQIICQRHLSP